MIPSNLQASRFSVDRTMQHSIVKARATYMYMYINVVRVRTEP